MKGLFYVTNNDTVNLDLYTINVDTYAHMFYVCKYNYSYRRQV